MINDRVAQNAIEPRDDAFVLANVRAALERSDECRLKDIFRGSARLHPLLDERKKLPVTLHQSLYRVGRHTSQTNICSPKLAYDPM